MKRDGRPPAGPPLAASCLVGLAFIAAGLLLGSERFLRFAAARFSPDRILDPYTLDRLGEFAWKLAAIGVLTPLIAVAAPAALARSAGTRGARVVAVVCLAGLMGGFLAVAWITPYRASAPRSQPDEIQYTIPAINLIERGRLTLAMNGREYPPYTPIGFQLLLVPFYRFLGTAIGNGIRAVQACALLSLAGVFLLGARALGRRVGLVAALLLASNPTFIFWTRGIMPSTAIVALTLGALLVLLAFREAESGRGRLLLAALLGALSGLQLFVSFNTITTVPIYLVLMLYLAAGRRGAGGAWACALAFAAAAAAALLPQFAYQACAYGSPLRTGYYVWFWQPAPPGVERDNPFGLVRQPYDFLVLDLFAKLGFDARVINPVALLLDLAGLGALYNLAAALLCAAGFAALLRRPRGAGGVIAWFAVLFILVNYAAYACYLTQGTRFFLQAVPCVLVVAAEGFFAAFAAARGRFAPWARLLLCVVLACALSGAAGAARERCAARGAEPCLYEIAEAYRGLAGPGSVVVSGISGAYLCHFLPPERAVAWIPLSGDVRLASQARRPLFPVAAEERVRLRRGVAAGTPVFTDDYHAESFAKEYRAIEEEFALERVRSVCGYGIFRLREKPRAGGESAGALRGGQARDTRYTTGEQRR